MSDPNIFISNGTCYSAPGKKLEGSFIPCGNDAFGHKACCGAGDNCLADNACFGFHGSGYGSYLTYMAGCSDPDYKDSSCPEKDIDQPWIALTLCDNSNGTWAVCSQEGNPSTLRPGSFCTCTDASSATVAFRDATSLTSHCSLPQSTGQSIQFFVGNIPTSPPSSGTTAPASSSGSTSASATPTQTRSTTSSLSGTGVSNRGTPSPSGIGTTSPDNGTGSGLSSGAKAGIGVGAAVGGLILLAAIAALFFLRRKRRRTPSEIEGGSANGTKPSKPDSSEHQRVPPISTTPTVWAADGQVMAEADGRAAQPWSLRGELEGSQVAPNQAEHSRGGTVVGDAHEGRARKIGELSLAAELPGSGSWQATGMDLHKEERYQLTKDRVPQGVR